MMDVWEKTPELGHKKYRALLLMQKFYTIRVGRVVCGENGISCSSTVSDFGSGGLKKFKAGAVNFSADMQIYSATHTQVVGWNPVKKPCRIFSEYLLKHASISVYPGSKHGQPIINEYQFFFSCPHWLCWRSGRSLSSIGLSQASLGTTCKWIAVWLTHAVYIATDNVLCSILTILSRQQPGPLLKMKQVWSRWPVTWSQWLGQPMEK